MTIGLEKVKESLLVGDSLMSETLKDLEAFVVIFFYPDCALALSSSLGAVFFPMAISSFEVAS